MLYSIYLIKIDTILEVYLEAFDWLVWLTLKFCKADEGIVEILFPTGLYCDVTSTSKLNLSSYARISSPIVFEYAKFCSVWPTKPPILPLPVWVVPL